MRRPAFVRSVSRLHPKSRTPAGRHGFALLEMLIVIGILSAVTALSIPAYREYQIRSDLDKTAQQVTQGLARARLLATSGQHDSAWGFYVPSGTLYKGESYATRDTGFDEVFPMPSTIAVSGLLDVSYSRVSAKPSAVGDITLRALNDDQRIIQVTIAVDEQSLATNQTDVLTICHHNSSTPGDQQTITVPDSTWPYHQSLGDTVGACAGSASSMSSAAASSVSSAASSTSSVIVVGGSSSSVTSSAAGGGGGGGGSSSAAGACSKIAIGSDQTITLSATSSVTLTNMLSQITFGVGGPSVPVHACYSSNNGSAWSPLFGGNGNCNGNGNAYGNAVKPAGTDTKTLSLSSGNKFVLEINGKYTQNGWLAFNQTFASNDKTGHILYLLNGDTLSNFPGFGSQVSLKTYLTSKGLLNAQGKVVLGSCDVLSITELGTLNTASADFQDDVLKMSFN